MASFIDTNVPPHGSLMMSLPIRTQFTTAANEITQLQNRVSVLEQAPSGGDTNWGDISGSIRDQTDLYDWLNDLQPMLTSGQNIVTINGQSLLASGNLQIAAEGGGTVTSITAGNGIATNPPSGITHTGYVSLAPLPTPPPSGPITNATVTVDQYGRVISAVAGAPPGETAPATWGTITGNLASQSDLNTALLDLNNSVNTRQPLLVWTGGSANIRTVGGQSLQGPGDIPLPAPGTGSVAFNAITGQPTDNAALNTALNARQPLLVWTGGSANIRTVGGQSLQGPGDIALPEPGGGAGVIGQAGVASLTSQTGETQPVPLLQIRNTTGAATGAFPSTNFQFGFIRVQGVSGVNTYALGFEIQVRSSNTTPWDGSNRGTEVQFWTGRRNTVNPATAFTIGHDGGLIVAAGGGDRGPGTVNAMNYFLNGRELRQWIMETFYVLVNGVPTTLQEF